MSGADLLPSNSTPLERAMATAAARILAIDLPIDRMWDPETIPAEFLPWLAWSLSVDIWDPEWTEETKRKAIAASIEVHRHKGSVGAVKRAVEAAGLGDAEIIEGWSANTFNGSFSRNGSRLRENSDHWAEYRVILRRPMSIAQSQRARAIIEDAAPVRSHLKLMSFLEAALLYNAAVVRDGAYTRGIV